MELGLVSLINTQIQKELESAYLYLGVSSFFEKSGLGGFASWFKKQSAEEVNHAMKFYDYMHEREQNVVLLPIAPPEDKITEIQQALVMSLGHEKYITSLIRNIYEGAIKCGDLATRNFLEWFIGEQREEEVQAKVMLDRYELFGKSPEGLYQLDKEFGKRN